MEVWREVIVGSKYVRKIPSLKYTALVRTFTAFHYPFRSPFFFSILIFILPRTFSWIDTFQISFFIHSFIHLISQHFTASLLLWYPSLLPAPFSLFNLFFLLDFHSAFSHLMRLTFAPCHPYLSLPVNTFCWLNFKSWQPCRATQPCRGLDR